MMPYGDDLELSRSFVRVPDTGLDTSLPSSILDLSKLSSVAASVAVSLPRVLTNTRPPNSNRNPATTKRKIEDTNLPPIKRQNYQVQQQQPPQQQQQQNFFLYPIQPVRVFQLQSVVPGQQLQQQLQLQQQHRQQQQQQQQQQQHQQQQQRQITKVRSRGINNFPHQVAYVFQTPTTTTTTRPTARRVSQSVVKQVVNTLAQKPQYGSWNEETKQLLSLIHI